MQDGSRRIGFQREMRACQLRMSGIDRVQGVHKRDRRSKRWPQIELDMGLAPRIEFN